MHRVTRSCPRSSQLPLFCLLPIRPRWESLPAVVMPHPEVPFEGFLVGIEKVVVGSDATPGVHLGERLKLWQLGFRQCLRILNELHHLFAPLYVQPLLVRVVAERPLLEFLRAAGDLC